MMNCSDILDFISIIISLAAVITSIVIAIKTLKQNNKMLEESTRPYISLSYEAVHMGVMLTYIMIKNYGQTVAKITVFDFEEDKIKDQELVKRLKRVPGLTLAPGQKRLYTFSQGKIEEEKKQDKADGGEKSEQDKADNEREPAKTIAFRIEYKSPTKTYCDNQTLSLRTGYHIERAPINDDNVDGHILQALEEIAERLI